MLRFPLATSLIGMLATPFARASPINIRSPGDPAPIDIRIWALPNSHTTTGISTLINGQEQFRETTAEDFAFQPARKPSGSDQEYNMVGVMTFDVVPDKPRAMYITSDTLPAGANVSFLRSLCGI